MSFVSHFNAFFLFQLFLPLDATTVSYWLIAAHGRGQDFLCCLFWCICSDLVKIKDFMSLFLQLQTLSEGIMTGGGGAVGDLLRPCPAGASARANYTMGQQQQLGRFWRETSPDLIPCGGSG